MKRISTSATAVLAAAVLGALLYGAPPAAAETGGGGTAQVAGIPEWQVGHRCAAGDLIVYGGHVYRCLVSHVFVMGWEPPNTPALWRLVK
ncbi:carbohydrate-binding protein [Streptosporangium sp. NPDC051022]|uniref:carbohydrate-binding protein n=1 Tax=Streptosporangium sp. NPDC051022 TaxID=3155752 RepID=UPI00342E2DA0